MFRTASALQHYVSYVSFSCMLLCLKISQVFQVCTGCPTKMSPIFCIKYTTSSNWDILCLFVLCYCKFCFLFRLNKIVNIFRISVNMLINRYVDICKYVSKYFLKYERIWILEIAYKRIWNILFHVKVMAFKGVYS